MTISRNKLVGLLTAIFGCVFIALAISPYDRGDWALENVLVVFFALALGLSYKSFPLSRLSYVCIFLFLILHEIGAHNTYAKVPYDAFLIRTFGFSLNDLMGWDRNHFDRLVHFLFGVLFAYPIRELYCRLAGAKGFWAYFFPIEMVMASSMIFELFEWGAASFFGGDLGVAYLGTQGDVWDAHKDMALASLGAFLAMAAVFVINMKTQGDFWQEWKSSLSVKAKDVAGV
ncbi:MAG: DUF2238 domain-containing protein [Cohaesibacter sp.]|jgi:putative membrane protein|nr:DUF2238 domain-containing protein [Cohaesibacter sp.]